MSEPTSIGDSQKLRIFTVIFGIVCVMACAVACGRVTAVLAGSQQEQRPKAGASHSDVHPIPTPYDDDGYSALGKITAKECLSGSDIDLTIMVAKMADLQSKGLIKNDVDEAHVKAHAWTTASAIALHVEPMLIVSVFKDHPKLEGCGFVQTITGFDGKTEAAFSFNLTRAGYDKIKWAEVTPQSWPTDVRDFKLGPVTVAKMNEENK